MTNPLLQRSPLPFELPDFAALTPTLYAEAVREGMREQQHALTEVVDQTEAPTFENTVGALEDAGLTLRRAASAFFSVASADGDDQMRDLLAELAGELSAHEDEITMNSVLFDKVGAVQQAGDLTQERSRLVERYLERGRLAGAQLDEGAKAELRTINTELAELTTEFGRRVLKDGNDLAVHVTDRAELDGLTEAQIEQCAAAAAEAGRDGYLIKIFNTTSHPFLSSLTNRELRRRLYLASSSKGRRSNQYDTTDLIRSIVRLRARKARLLGFETFAHLSTADQTVKNPETIRERIYPLAAAAGRNIAAEAANLQQVVDRLAAEQGTEPFTLAPWDWDYYTEIAQAEQFGVDGESLRPYFEFESTLVNGVFHAANLLYGITFTRREDLRGYNDDVLVYQVREADGSDLALLLYDPYARATKNGGAWMNNAVDQSHRDGTMPVVCQNLNLVRPAKGQPLLMSLDEVNTMFHEFGHALHGFFADQEFAALSGTAVPRDFVEFPSQVNELWQLWPEVLQHYARHVETGEVLGQDVVDQLQQMGTFNQGFRFGELLAAALLDQEFHALADGEAEITDVAEFTDQALERIGLASPYLLPRYLPNYFSHTFAGGYEAAYYGYIWAEILDADTVDWFTANGGPTRANGDLFRAELLSRGDGRDPMVSFEKVVGRAPDMTPLLKRRGLV